MFPRHAIDPARNRVGLVAADHKSALLFAHVNQIIGVTQTGRVLRELMPGHSLERDVLMIHRRGRQVDTDHRSDARRPQPGGVDDRFVLIAPLSVITFWISPLGDS